MINHMQQLQGMRGEVPHKGLCSICRKKKKGKSHSIQVLEGGRGLAFTNALLLPQFQCSLLTGLFSDSTQALKVVLEMG